MRWLRNGDADLSDLRDAFAQAGRGEGPGARGQVRTGEPICPRCQRSERVDHLGGRHMCRVIARYKCPVCRKAWTSQRGRFDPREGRVLDQFCSGAACGQCKAEVVSWEHLSEEALIALQDRRSAAQTRVTAATRIEEEAFVSSEFGDGQGSPQYDPSDDEPAEDFHGDFTNSWSGGGHGWYQGDTWQNHPPGAHTGGYPTAGHHMGTYVVGEARAASHVLPSASHKGAGKANGYGGKGNGKGTVGSPWGVAGKGKSGKRHGKGPRGKGGKWQVVAGSAAIEDVNRQQTIVPRLITQEHRPDLCEPCRKWGDCSGWFADPFFVFAAATFLVEQAGGYGSHVYWEEGAAGFELQGTEELGSIQLIVETRFL